MNGRGANEGCWSMLACAAYINTCCGVARSDGVSRPRVMVRVAKSMVFIKEVLKKGGGTSRRLLGYGRQAKKGGGTKCLYVCCYLPVLTGFTRTLLPPTFINSFFTWHQSSLYRAMTGTILPWQNGGERGIRTLDARLRAYTISNHAPSASQPSLRAAKTTQLFLQEL